LKSRYLANWDIAPIKGEIIDPALRQALNNPFYPRFWPEKLEQPLKRKMPAGIFVCDMSDLFGIGIPEQWTHSVFNFIEKCPQHRFYLLTKQPQNLAQFSPFPDNCWVGVTATDAQMFIGAGHALENIHAKVKYISAEPLLDWDLGGSGFIATMLKQWGINWIISGARTSRNYWDLAAHNLDGSLIRDRIEMYGKIWTLQPKEEWVNEIISAAEKVNIPVFMKDNLKPLPRTDTPFIQEMPA
jgi:hypothetical protein